MQHSLSLLLVEDDASLLEELTIFLSDFFDTIDVSTNAEDAYEKFLSAPYDLIITDIKLPRQDGLSFIEKIKKNSPLQMVIVISAYKEVDYFLKSIELGIYSFLTKPFNSQQLINTMIKATLQINHLHTQQNNSIVILDQNTTYSPSTKALHVNNIAQELTVKEELLLALLVKHVNHFVRNEQIIQEVWQNDTINSSTLRALVKRIRDKLGYDNAIINLKNRGYKLNSTKII
ncbi:MAG: response regulator transcription factor [Campylobacteraceae bacterium]|nr:response regulator transcription factor [Campylobacteraceae bacterium]